METIQSGNPLFDFVVPMIEGASAADYFSCENRCGGIVTAGVGTPAMKEKIAENQVASPNHSAQSGIVIFPVALPKVLWIKLPQPFFPGGSG